MTEFANRDRVRIKKPAPLPSGRSVQLVGLVERIFADGRIEVRVSTPGIYGGGFIRCAPDELERV